MKDTLFAIGEALIDFIPDKKGCDFADVGAFSPCVGGAPANVLGAFAKLGGKTELLTQLGDDPFGHKIKNSFEKWGIGVKFVKMTEDANTALAFVSLEENGNRTFSFYRNPSADMLYSADNIDKKDFERCYALHFCSVSLGDFPMREAHQKTIALAKEEGAIISFDINLRFPLWKSKEALKKAIDEFLPFADIIKISDEEMKFVTGTDDIEKGCELLLKNALLVICTCGADGAYVFWGDRCIYSLSEKVEAVDTTGAGDAFCGSFLYNLYSNGISKENLGNISDEILKRFLDQSNGYCGKSVQKNGAIDSYPCSL